MKKRKQATAGRPVGSEIAFYTSGDRHAARYVSDTTVREEALQDGRFIGLYWSASGQVQRENVTASLPGCDPLTRPLHVFELGIDGQSLHNRWAWAGSSEAPGRRPGTVEAAVELRHQVRPITVRVVTRLDGSPVMARWLEVTNTGASPAALSQIAPWSGLIWDTDTGLIASPPGWNPAVSQEARNTRFSLGYFRAEGWGLEGDFRWVPLSSECLRIERDSGKSFSWPYFVLRNEITGEICFIALAWSGNWYAEFSHRHETSLFFDVGPLGPAPLRVIAPGETVASPEVHLGLMHRGMDEAVRAWHQHLRTSVVPPRPAGKEMYTLAGRVVEEPGDWMLREIDIAAEMGVEAFMVDAGWYGEDFSAWTEQRGDWFEGDWLPGGMAHIREYVHDRGMLFGLWMEPETVAPKSRLYREHPDWILTTDGGRPVGTMGLNLAHPEAAQHVEDSIIRVIRDFGLDFFKLDYNIRVGEGAQNLRDGYAEHEMWRHFEVLYRVFDRVLAEFPHASPRELRQRRLAQ